MNPLGGFVINTISNNTIGVPIVLTPLSVGSWVFLGGMGNAGHCSADYSCDPFAIDEYRYNPDDGKW